MCYTECMTNDPMQWVKVNKKSFAENLIKESGVVSDNVHSAIFMAGLPGSGKTEFTKNLIEGSDLKVVRLDMDEIAASIDGYRPEIADGYRGAASELLNRAFDLVLKKKLDFIMDGTFSSDYAIKNIERTLNYGYHIKIIYVFQDPKRAWDFTRAREKIEHRAISIDGFIDSYFRIPKNINEVFEKYKGCGRISLDIIIKDENNKVSDRITDLFIAAVSVGRIYGCRLYSWLLRLRRNKRRQR